MPAARRAREAGADAIAVLRKRLAEKAAAALRAEPDRMASAVELGIVDRKWLDEPGEHPISTSAPLEVIQRFLERSVEQQPSMISQLGLNAIQMLSWSKGDPSEAMAPQPVTISFTDLEGFTSYTSQQGDEAALALLTEVHRKMGPVIRSRGGRIVKRLGDGLLLVFGAPEAAVLAGVELIETVKDPLRLRVGVHVGEAVVTADDVIGHDVNVAARVTEAARGGEVLATLAVRDAVGDLPVVMFGRSKRANFKGVDERIQVCSVAAV